MLPEHLRMHSAAPSRPELTFQGPNYRISVITDGIIRCEWSERGCFEDRASQVVVNRDAGPVDCEVQDTDEHLIIRTSRLDFYYNKGPFTPAGLHATIRALPTHHAVWRVGQKPAESLPDSWRNYGGTVRTLDDVDGETDLGFGFNSFVGYSELDDSKSLVFDESGWVTSRADTNARDVYVVGYGRDHQETIQAIHQLTGPSPLLPRWALGNWWSRYHAYSDDEYLMMLNEFSDKKIPLSVAIVDMDWHITDVDPELGTGWTGFTWDRSLFANPAEFLAGVKSQNLVVGLNLHPADGIRRHEECYPEAARAVDQDPAEGEPVRFDAGSTDFWKAYFLHALHPLEKQGVDFWWVDWQQGTFSSVPGLDPLWALNHLHYLDSGRPRPATEGGARRPLTFSRFSGVGSHRYPVGFSGDSVMSWSSLEFQPKLTATSSNVAYGWWSHDIGGHMAGTTDPELYARWVQLGCFSPILRLHSTRSDEIRREPWLFEDVVSNVVVSFMRLRHQLVPYLYSMNDHAHRRGIPLVRPMYWTHPDSAEAKSNLGQFWFGQDLLVVPIVQPLDEHTHLGHVSGYLPEGVWVDILTGTVYDGGRVVTFCRPLSGYPVLAPAGTVLPLTSAVEAAGFGVALPESVDLVVVAGGSGSFTLVEDDDSPNPDQAHTTYSWDWDSKTLTISPVQGSSDCIPSSRTYRAIIVGVDSGDETNRVTVDLGVVDTATGGTWTLEDSCPTTLATNTEQLAQRVFALPMPVLTKKALNLILNDGSIAKQAARVMTLDLPESTKEAIFEVLTSRVE